ncbi:MULTISPECIES: hypothetical protein [Rhodopseudomonas]|uniref:hypothetical protein n=1 Tax=Rhodopseudomonas TaxID=1073 RepID=UPI0011C028E2|nr:MULTISPECIES: hypothetical protein [Rhodopseudomonas]
MPIKGREDSVLSSRAEFFKHALELVCNSAVNRGRLLFYHEGAPHLLAHVYFALHDAFKSYYLRDGHLTDAAKRAAVSCAAVIAVAPLHLNPDEPPVIDLSCDEDADYPNPFLAVRCAAAFLPHPFHKKTWDARRRDYVGFTGLRFPSVDPIIDEWANNGGIVRSSWAPPPLSAQEESVLALLANGFQTAALLQVPEQEGR